jgi:hypothetical protein
MDITTIIPTSPIPSHPDTSILDLTVQKIRKYTEGPIIIMCDGVHQSLKHRKDDYIAYIEKIRNRYPKTAVMVFDGHQHQAIMTRETLKNVQTELILFVEHDAYIDGDIPFQEICDLVRDSEEINYVRFNIFEQIPKEHGYLMLGAETHNEIPLQRTIQWSQRPHIAKKAWYQDILNMHFGKEDRTMIEDVMHSVVQVEYDKKGRDTFGLAIYTPEGNQLRSFHSDGRGKDEKIITG